MALKKYWSYLINGGRLPVTKREAIRDACGIVESIIDIGAALTAEARTERLIAVQKTLSGILHDDDARKV